MTDQNEKFVDDWERYNKCSKKRVDASIAFFVNISDKEIEYPKGTFWGMTKRPKKKFFGIAWSKFDIIIFFFGGVFPTFSAAAKGDYGSMIVYLLICLWILLLKWTETTKDEYFKMFMSASNKTLNLFSALAFLRAEYEDLYDNPATHKMKEKEE